MNFELIAYMVRTEQRRPHDRRATPRALPGSTMRSRALPRPLRHRGR